MEEGAWKGDNGEGRQRRMEEGGMEEGMKAWMAEQQTIPEPQRNSSKIVPECLTDDSLTIH